HLPITPGVVGPNCGDCGSSGVSASAGFVAKFSAGGSKLVWATYVPVVLASTNVAIVEIATMSLDDSGNIIMGGTTSKGLPVTSGALQTVFPGPSSSSFAGFVMKLDSAAQRFLFSTYFGGNAFGTVFGLKGLVVDRQGSI